MAGASVQLTIGVVEDDEDFRDLVVELVREVGGEPVPLATAEEAIAAIAADRVQAVLTDYRLPGERDGEDVVRACRDGERALPVAVMSVVDSVTVARRLLDLGADDYLVKPMEAEQLVSRIGRFLEGARRRVELDDLRGLFEGVGSSVTNKILGGSPALHAMLRLLPRAARSGAPVLVLGESGTGKELVARAVHELSRRREGPFVAVDCASIPESLFENELFGHKKGAYSDARDDRVGLVERADGGTLFLDEAGELPLPVQAKLLRFLQTKEYRRLGESKVSSSDVRVAAATNRDLAAEVGAGRFRQDLYYRLDVIRLELPPLRDRREDIPVLASAFLRRYADEFESPARAIAPEAMDHLVSLPWPGNVRELENCVQRAVAMTLGPVLGVDDFAGAGASLPATEDGGVTVDATIPFHDAKSALIARFEKEYARRILTRHHGNLSAAARAAGLDRKSLSRLLDRHGLTVEDVTA